MVFQVSWIAFAVESVAHITYFIISVCYNCNKLGHKSDTCWRNKRNRPATEDDDDEEEDEEWEKAEKGEEAKESEDEEKDEEMPTT